MVPAHQLVGTHLSEPGYTDLTYVRTHPGFPDVWVYPWLGFRACEELLHNIHAGVQALLDPAAPPVRLLQLPKFTSFLGPGEPPADEHLFISVAVAAIMSQVTTCVLRIVYYYVLTPPLQAAIKGNTTVLVLTPVYTVHNLDAAVEHNMISCSMTDTEGNQMLCYATDGTSMFFLLAEEGDAMRIADEWNGTIHINNTDVIRVTLMASIWTTTPLTDRDTAEQYLVLEHPQCRAHMGGPGVQPLHMPRPIPFMPCTSGIPTKWTVDTLGSLNGRDPVPYFCPTYRLGPNSDCLSLFRIVPPTAATSIVQLTDLFVANIVTACLGGGETATPPPPPKPAKIVRARLTVSSEEKPPKKVAPAPPVVAAKKPPATKATAKRKDPAPAGAATPKKGGGAAKAPTVKKRPTVTAKPKVVVAAAAVEPMVVAAVAEPVVVAPAPAPVDPTPPDNQMWFAFAHASTTIGYRSITDLQPGDGSRISSSRATYAQVPG